MKAFSGFVIGLSRVLDRISGLCMVSIMVLVVANILLRVLFKRPVLGTYEYVGFLTAALIGLALANCAVQRGHIAIGILVDRLAYKTQAVIDIFIYIVSIAFWAISAWYIAQYARSLTINGVVSPTTQIPFYPFIYLISLGLVALCLVLTVKLMESVKRAAFNR